MKKICLCCLALICLTNLFAQETVNYKEKMPYKTWVKMAPKLNDELAQKHLYACRTDSTGVRRCTCL